MTARPQLALAVPGAVVPVWRGKRCVAPAIDVVHAAMVAAREAHRMHEYMALYSAWRAHVDFRKDDGR